MTKKRTKAECEAELKYLRKSMRADSFVRTFKTFINTSGYVLVAMFVYLSLNSITVNLAGKTTDADINVSLITRLFSFDFITQKPISVAIAGGVFGIAGMLYGKWQRGVRMSTVERLQARIVKLEQKKDLKRTTSHLTPKGETNPGDK